MAYEIRKIEWHKVTPLSKGIAMAIFIIFPFVGFWLGIKYDRLIGGGNQIPKFLTVDTSTGHQTYRTDAISFTVDPQKVGVDYDINDGLAVRSHPEKTHVIKITDPDTDAVLEIFLNLDGLGGGCPDFPTGYKLTPIPLDGKIVYKAQLVDKSLTDRSQFVGDIFLVDKFTTNNEKHWECPNVAGLNPQKNKGSRIIYRMNNLPTDSPKYKESERIFDDIVESIRFFWN